MRTPISGFSFPLLFLLVIKLSTAVSDAPSVPLFEEVHYDPTELETTDGSFETDETLTEEEKLWINNWEIIDKLNHHYSREPDGLLDLNFRDVKYPQHLLLEPHQIQLLDRDRVDNSSHPFDIYYNIPPEADQPYKVHELEPRWKDSTPPWKAEGVPLFLRMHRLGLYASKHMNNKSIFLQRQIEFCVLLGNSIGCNQSSKVPILFLGLLHSSFPFLREVGTHRTIRMSSLVRPKEPILVHRASTSY